MLGSRSTASRGRARRPGATLLAAVCLVAVPPPVAAAAPPGAPELVAPAPGRVFGVAEPQVFTVRATDPDGDRWVGIVEVTSLDTGRVTTFPTAPSGSGEYSGGVAVPVLTPGRYVWRARAADTTGSIGAWSVTADFRVGSNRPPNAPRLLAPAEGATLRRLGNEPFSISATDLDGDVVSGTVTIRRANGTVFGRIETSPSISGGTSSGVLVQPLPEGTYTWSAVAVDAFGARSGPSVVRTFVVGPSPTAGGGAVAGTMTFAAPGLPSVIGSCEGSSSSLRLDSAAAVFNTTIVGYVGPVVFRGSGASPCESVLSGSGSLTLDVTGTSATGSTLACTGLTGSYTRVATALVLSLSGGCVVNDFPVSRVALDVALQFVPTDSGASVTARTEHAAVGGVFAVLPE